jgi:hypothetical protein
MRRPNFLFVFTIAIVSSVPARAQLAQIEDLADKLSTPLGQPGRRVIAVLDFTSDRLKPDFGKYFSRRLTTKLASSPKGLEVVERAKLDDAMHEIQRKYAQGFSQKAFVEMGQWVGAEVIVVGDYAKRGDSIDVSANVIDVKRGVIIGGGETSIPLTPDILDIVGDTGGSSAPVPYTPPTAGRGDVSISRSPATVPSAPASGQAVPPEQEVEGITISLRNCSVLGNSVTCRFTLLSKESDLLVGIWATAAGGSQFIDQKGRQYQATSVEIGSVRADNVNRYPLIRDTAVNGRIIFRGVTAVVDEVRALNVLLRNESGGNRVAKAEFRNVPLGN